MGLFRQSSTLPGANEALPGRPEPIETAQTHFVNGHFLAGPYPEGSKQVLFGMGCFWGAERKFWSLPGVYVTAVGYAGGVTPNPTYEEVCTGLTGHTEVVQVVYEKGVDLASLLRVFWENHDPTQGMRQGNDIGTQYRSAVYVTGEAELALVEATRRTFGEALRLAGYPPITTEVAERPPFYFAEAYHQQYLAKNPAGYCGLGGTGVSCAIGTGVAA
ncbi:peptide-methionine (S)-S-oxide reductase MsrA [Chelatococcus asaccharovorans]|uniref:Peptide methionine sulfoxide reductase MsrA n=1 Tax=Chelatococcus asaccharovorans TaxID=28210 RepID=A0A2V3TRX1_9HYPH|nr:peptide-methionine (S)-S-oxide reductase MsrA [Chelatococcus asaccharovorans]MBS7704896.1 peptide-methionine (S)-S-oxide reductase MsrA [Chelatococcus asaccharovorans]PXW51359.1 peptide-methionine (S)-S-oxide reductase [Chelatococcus asaccharovorans]CAH1650986.1 methionine sulfoxide reductase A [Chelatococcus asaccharovorans]CAH1686686.1 methionine sulfoxide reductase A [Chelatococcus asaccharovorans]